MVSARRSRSYEARAIASTDPELPGNRPYSHNAAHVTQRHGLTGDVFNPALHFEECFPDGMIHLFLTVK